MVGAALRRSVLGLHPPEEEQEASHRAVASSLSAWSSAIAPAGTFGSRSTRAAGTSVRPFPAAQWNTAGSPPGRSRPAIS
nr:hypothetical protein [Streptomyces durhamensis]